MADLVYREIDSFFLSEHAFVRRESPIPPAAAHGMKIVERLGPTVSSSVAFVQSGHRKKIRDESFQRTRNNHVFVWFASNASMNNIFKKKMCRVACLSSFDCRGIAMTRPMIHATRARNRQVPQIDFSLSANPAKVLAAERALFHKKRTVVTNCASRATNTVVLVASTARIIGTVGCSARNWNFENVPPLDACRGSFLQTHHAGPNRVAESL